MSTPFKTLSQELAHEFAEAGITDAFLVTGGAIAPLTTAIAEQGRIRMHFMLTEQSAGIAAEAYGYLDLKPALLIVTSGPGVTNALTPVAAAWTNSSPMIVISGQARSSDVALSKNVSSRQVGSQHLRTDKLVESIVKLFIEIEEPRNSKTVVSALKDAAINGRPGPVWLSIPQDIQRGPRSSESLKLEIPLQEAESGAIDFEKLVIDYLSKCKSPAILVGAGSRNSFSEILSFAEHFRIPILTTWSAIDLLPDDHPLYCGRPGSIPSSWVPNYINVETDFLLIFGVRLDLGQVGYNPSQFALKANVVRIDIDELEFSRISSRENWHNICADINSLTESLSRLKQLDITPEVVDWWGKIDEWKKFSPRPNNLSKEFEDGVSSYEMISHASDLFKNSLVVTGSSGTCMEMVLQAWAVKKGQRIINSCGLGSMGFAVAAAIGVSTKVNSAELLCIESDGSLSMNLQDLTTMATMNSVFKLIVMDSSGYKSIQLSQKRSGQSEHGHDFDTGLILPDLHVIGEAVGFKVQLAKKNSELISKLTWLKSCKTSAMLIVKVSSKEEALPRLISRPNEKGIMETPPMDDLWPKV